MAKSQISLDQFLAGSKPVKVGVNGQERLALPRKFSTGSFGYFLNDKFVVDVNGVPITVQASVTLTVVGSKPGKGAEE